MSTNCGNDFSANALPPMIMVNWRNAYDPKMSSPVELSDINTIRNNTCGKVNVEGLSSSGLAVQSTSSEQHRERPDFQHPHCTYNGNLIQSDQYTRSDQGEVSIRPSNSDVDSRFIRNFTARTNDSLGGSILPFTENVAGCSTQNGNQQELVKTTDATVYPWMNRIHAKKSQ